MYLKIEEFKTSEQNTTFVVERRTALAKTADSFFPVYRTALSKWDGAHLKVLSNAPTVEEAILLGIKELPEWITLL